MPPTIHLTPFTTADTADAALLWTDAATVRYTNWPLAVTPADVDARMARLMARYAAEPRHFGPFAIRRDDGRFVGLAGAELCADADRTYEVWYVLRRDEWGRGLASLALGDLLHRMAASGRVRTAVATAVTANVASWKILERHGFVRERIIPGGHTAHGEGLDVYAYRKAVAPA